MQLSSLIGGLLILILVWLACRLQYSQKWQPFAFSVWVLATVVLALTFPSVFDGGDGKPAAFLVFPLIQIIMFGMGTTLSWRDFCRVGSRWPSVLIGLGSQFTIMPLVGWGLARTLHVSPELTLGIVLIGSCPGGVASNVITFLARGDVALSVTLTACSTLMAPLMTPLAVSLLLGTNLEIPFLEMARQIAWMVFVPTIAGLVLGSLLDWLKYPGATLNRWMSSIAMIAICIVIGIIVAQTRDNLLQVGWLVLMAAAMHNAVGLLLGYWLARIFRLTESECRTISIEVGMQNGGMGTALALNVLKSPTAALVPAVFAPWMSVTGAILASYWRKKDRSDSPTSADGV
ncbi:MAG: bile acid:sodium symporter family protein [Pirellulaceae bacterium]|nr:bile acid:sodium symporter family protein [Pirellulaceae bacterium]